MMSYSATISLVKPKLHSAEQALLALIHCIPAGILSEHSSRSSLTKHPSRFVKIYRDYLSHRLTRDRDVQLPRSVNRARYVVFDNSEIKTTIKPRWESFWHSISYRDSFDLAKFLSAPLTSQPPSSARRVNFSSLYFPLSSQEHSKALLERNMICSEDSEDDIAGDANKSFHGCEMSDIESDDVVVWEGSSLFHLSACPPPSCIR
ncbi:hypothetical protein V5O48_003145 [Marasmius crinis-equi]|uniref:Uncharacterized protein n=1 Tax=Marasmius crinis-equi TaxID=585013 RepID=A0ABR3FTP9_9AGAR